jgi:hypothetical protein
MFSRSLPDCEPAPNDLQDDGPRLMPRIILLVPVAQMIARGAATGFLPEIEIGCHDL